MTTQKPIHEVKVGRVRAAIWARETKNGTRYGVTIGRLYKTDEGKWRTSSSLDLDDLLLGQRAYALAESWIREADKTSAKAEPAAEEVA